MALTDHNSCKNCPAFFTAARRQGIIPIAGMELTTSEDIHVIFLFEELSDAMKFDNYLDSRRILVENRVDVYGEQMIMDSEDNVIGTEKHLLSVATTVSVDECPALSRQFGAVCYPAHIDRQANGIISVLGTFPDVEAFTCVELHDGEKREEYYEKYNLGNRVCVVGSDAHYLWDIRDKEHYFTIDDEPYSGNFVRHQFFKILRGNK